MDSFHRLYLRLTLVQGLALALATGLTIQWLHWSSQSASRALIDSESPRAVLEVGTSWKGGTVIFLGTWGIVAGATGWLVMREQRDQMLSLLQKHDTAVRPDLQLVSEDEPVFTSPDLTELDSIRELAVLPAPFRLRLATGEEHAWEEAETSPSRTPQLAVRHRPEV